MPSFYLEMSQSMNSYSGRCSFTQYIPSKPGKYGIKFWMLSDSMTSYVHRLHAYIGRHDPQAREHNLGERVVFDLCRGLRGRGINITCDNFFTSMQLLQKLKRDKLTLLRTVAKTDVSFYQILSPPKDERHSVPNSRSRRTRC